LLKGIARGAPDGLGVVPLAGGVSIGRDSPEHQRCGKVKAGKRDAVAPGASERHSFDTPANSAGFAWIDCCDAANSVIAFVRRARTEAAPVLVVCNFTPVVRQRYRLGVPIAGRWREALNSDAVVYGGSGTGNLGGVETERVPAHGHAQSVVLTLPPLGILFLEPA